MGIYTLLYPNTEIKQKLLLIESNIPLWLSSKTDMFRVLFNLRKLLIVIKLEKEGLEEKKLLIWL